VPPGEIEHNLQGGKEHEQNNEAKRNRNSIHTGSASADWEHVRQLRDGTASARSVRPTVREATARQTSTFSFLESDTMKTAKVLIIGIISGLALLGIFSLLPIDGGIIVAIIVGVITGRLIDGDPMKYTFISTSTYNLIASIVVALFDPGAKIVLGLASEYKAVVGLLIGVVIIMIVFYSLIGSFSAFVAYNMRSDT